MVCDRLCFRFKLVSVFVSNWVVLIDYLLVGFVLVVFWCGFAGFVMFGLFMVRVYVLLGIVFGGR